MVYLKHCFSCCSSRNNLFDSYLSFRGNVRTRTCQFNLKHWNLLSCQQISRGNCRTRKQKSFLMMAISLSILCPGTFIHCPDPRIGLNISRKALNLYSRGHVDLDKGHLFEAKCNSVIIHLRVTLSVLLRGFQDL